MKPTKFPITDQQRDLFRSQLSTIIDQGHSLVKLSNIVDWSELEQAFGQTTQLKRVNVDTTVQEKNVRFPTDARLYDRARERLVKAAKEIEINLRQNYNRLSKHTLLKQSRYVHAKQMKRAKKATRRLRTFLGRVIRDIQRKYQTPDDELKDLLNVAARIWTHRKKDKNKVCSVHEPHVECISKGKVHKRDEYGCKVSVSTTSRGGWFVGAMAIHGNPYDGHTLSKTLDQINRMT